MDETQLQRLSAFGIDVEGTIRRFSGNLDLYEKFLLKFPEDASYGLMVKALEARDYETAANACHTLKGVAGNLGMVRLFEQSTQLLAVLRAADEEKSRELLARLQLLYDDVRTLIAALT